MHPSTARGPLSKQESDFEEHDATVDKIARPVATNVHHSGKAEVEYVSRLKICFLIMTRDSRWNVSRRAWSQIDINLKLESHTRIELALKSNRRFRERAAVYRSGERFRWVQRTDFPDQRYCPRVITYSRWINEYHRPPLLNQVIWRN